MKLTRRYLLSIGALLLMVVCPLARGPAASPASGEFPKPPVPPARWESYSSADYGFTIHYPKDFKVCEGPIDYCADIHRSFIPTCDPASVACLPYIGHAYDRTNFEGASFAVNVLRDKRTELDCNEFETGTGTRTINGVRFRHGVTDGAATGHELVGSVYRAFHNKVCFELAANVATGCYGCVDPGTIKEFHSTQLVRVLDSILRTFRFTGPVADGAAWRVYNIPNVGGSFEYPDGDTVVESVSWTQRKTSATGFDESVYFVDHELNYFVSTKDEMGDVRDTEKVDEWLKSASYPTLSQAQQLRHSSSWAEYRAGNYWYILGGNEIFVLGAQDQQNNVVAPPNDAVLRHFVNSFNP